MIVSPLLGKVTAPHVLREFGGIQIDTRRWPTLLLAFPDKPFSDACLVGALTCVEELLEPEAKSFQITDASPVRWLPPATQRKYAGDWSKEKRSSIQNAQRGRGKRDNFGSRARGLHGDTLVQGSTHADRVRGHPRSGNGSCAACSGGRRSITLGVTRGPVTALRPP
jgi:hypothetical protein